jgi:hypothetical protein
MTFLQQGLLTDLSILLLIAIADGLNRLSQHECCRDFREGRALRWEDIEYRRAQGKL